jgi:hypothetical protein
MALAGLLELADREFQAIQDEDVKLTEAARVSVERGNLDVELTPIILKTYLDQRLGSDGRIAPYSYEWTTRVLKSLGFRSLEQVDQCIEGYDDHKVSRIAQGYRQGQTTRFEHLLLAGMGRRFIDRHPWSILAWFPDHQTRMLQSLSESGVPIGNFDPLSTGEDD